jgi:CRISPR-associated protein Csm1
MEIEKVQLAALLHDIGKFYQRAGKSHGHEYNNLEIKDYGYSGAHGKWSASFVKEIFDDDDIEDLVLYHHNPKSDLGKIVQKADHHSAIERLDLKEEELNEKNRQVAKEPLISVFSNIKLNNNNKTDEHYIPLEPLSLKSSAFNDLKPVPGKNVNLDYKTLWNDFSMIIKRLKSPNFNTVLSLLKKYTSTMPSAAYVSKADISLYDHSKTTAGLATARYLFKESGGEKLKQTKSQKVYLAINGDISGIQKFIYDVSSPQDAQSGMSKRLRGRSLYLNLLNDAISSRLIEDLGLNQSNILFVGGGRFIIIAANIDEAKNKVNQLQDEVNDLFIDKFNGKLYLAISYEECSGDDLENFGGVTSNLNIKLSDDKKHKFINQLDKVFKIEDKIEYENTCPVCGMLTHNDDICSDCRSHENLGRVVANSEYMIKYFLKDKVGGFDFIEEKLKIAYSFKKNINPEFIKSLEDEIGTVYNKIEIIKLNDTDFLDIAEYCDKISLSFNFLANTVPEHDKTTLYFDHLAKISKGASKLGILKMDVDNLGKIFISGFNHLDGEKVKFKGGTISKISTLSSQLDMFFSGFINSIAENYKVFSKLCPDCEGKLEEIELQGENDTFKVYREKDEKVCDECSRYAIPTIHINYAGGDDLLVFGPYDDITYFAREFREKFRDWVCKNPDITISAGINIINSKFPIGKAAIKADEYLEASKNCGKDKITLFNDVVQWENSSLSRTYYELLDFSKELEKYVENEDISREMIYSMLNLWRNTFFNSNELITNEDDWDNDVKIRIEKKRYIPQFKYKSRLINNRSIREEFDKKGVKFMPWIKIPVSWASLRTRL